MMSLFQTIVSSFRALCSVWYREFRYMLLDEGMLLFVTLVPLLYPIAYSWIYNNEVVREVPVVVVDKSKTPQSRRFIHLYDASSAVRVAYYSTDLNEAKDLVGRQEAYGVIYIPSDFSARINRMEQATVGVYCDMTLMLVYKNVFQTATAVCSEMGTELQKQKLGLLTNRDEEVSTQPLRCEEVPLFNTTGGYGNFLLPAVLILILQQTMLLGMGLCSGTLREKYGRIILRDERYTNVAAIIGGKWLAYMLLYVVLAAYILLLIPKLFGIVSILYSSDFLMFLLPYLTSCIFFAMATMSIVRQREDVLLLVVFTSILLIFLSGVSWPSSNIPTLWQYVSWLFPSTFGIKSFIAMNSMGARFEDILPYVSALWLQTLVYGILAIVIYRRELTK